MSEKQLYSLTLTDEECESVFRALCEAYSSKVIHENDIPHVASVVDCLRERERLG